MKAVDLSNILKNYTTGWVSISNDHKKVVASAQTLNQLATKLKKMGNPEGYLMKASKDFTMYVGTQDSL